MTKPISMRSTAIVALVTTVLLAGGPVLDAARPARAQEPDPNTQTAEETIEDLEKRLRILERREELEKEKAAEEEQKAVKLSAGKDGFTMKSAAGAFLLKVRGYVQADGRFYRQDQDERATDTFNVQRARPIFEGTVFSRFDFKIMPDFGDGKTVLQEAYLDARFHPTVVLRAGKYKEPFGLERLQSATAIVFGARALPTNLAPNRDVGVHLWGEPHQGVVTYAVGIFNGVADNTVGDGDIDDGKEGAARLFVHPFRNTTITGVQGLGLGVAATLGSNEGAVAATGLPSYKSPGNQTIFSYLSDGKTLDNTVVAGGRRYRYSPQAYYYAGRFGLMAEYVVSSQEVALGVSSDTLAHRAWQATASLLLTDDRASYKGVDPKRAFDPGAGAWGAFEVAARYDRLDLDDGAFPVFADPGRSVRRATEWAAGVNWYLTRGVKIVLDYSRTSFEGGDPAGDREDEKIIFTRFQIGF